MGKYAEWAKARKNALDVVVSEASDATASKVPELYPTLTKSGDLVKAWTRIRWTDGRLYAAQYDMWDREELDPDHNPDGWAVLAYHDGYRDIPDVITTTTLFHKDEIGWYQDRFWKSLIDNNTWTPVAYPAGWKEVQV